MLNYCEWSKEYSQTAEEIEQVINKLKAQKRGASLSEKRRLTQNSANIALTITNVLKQLTYL